jgi:TolB protein
MVKTAVILACCLELAWLAPAGAGAVETSLAQQVIGYTEFRTNLPGGRHPNIATSRACVMRGDGSNRRELARDVNAAADAWTQFAGWSPDGRDAVVLFCSNTGANASWEEEHKAFRFSQGWLVDIVLIDLETKARRNLTEVDRVSSYNSGLFFWPDNRRQLGFTALIDGISHPFRMDVDGRNKRDLSAGPSGFTYGFEASPDGRRISYHKDYQVFIAGRDGSEPQRIETGRPFNFAPRWSPTGEWLLFLSGQHYDCHPHIVRADGSGLRKLADRSGYRGIVEILDVPDYHGGSSDVPVWSADGSSVFYTAKVGQSIELLRVNLSGESTQLTRSGAAVIHYHPVPSADGRWLSFGSTRADGRRQLFIMAEQGGEPRQLTAVPAGWAAMHAHWQPHGPQ